MTTKKSGSFGTISFPQEKRQPMREIKILPESGNIN